MKWFKHDCDSTADAKIRKLILKYGAVGYAIYFHCLELIGANVNDNNVTFVLEHDAEIIADNLKIQSEEDEHGNIMNTPPMVVQQVLDYIIHLQLFEINYDGKISCIKMLKRLDSSMTSNPRFRKLLQDAKLNHDGVMTLSNYSHDDVMQEVEIEIEEEIEEKNKKREDGEKRKTQRFVKPTVGELAAYAQELNYRGFEAQRFFDFYESKGWMVGKTPMKSWKAAVRNWQAGKDRYKSPTPPRFDTRATESTPYKKIGGSV